MSDKISLLVREGERQDVAVAIAMSVCAKKFAGADKHVQETPSAPWVPTPGETVDSSGSARAFLVAEGDNLRRGRDWARSSVSQGSQRVQESLSRVREVHGKMTGMISRMPDGEAKTKATTLIEQAGRMLSSAEGEAKGAVRESSVRLASDRGRAAIETMDAASRLVEETRKHALVDGRWIPTPGEGTPSKLSDADIKALSPTVAAAHDQWQTFFGHAEDLSNAKGPNMRATGRALTVRSGESAAKKFNALADELRGKGRAEMAQAARSAADTLTAAAAKVSGAKPGEALTEAAKEAMALANAAWDKANRIATDMGRRDLSQFGESR